MVAATWMVLSGVLGALSNLCMRRSLDNQGSPRLFFIMQLLLTFLVATCLYPIRTGIYVFDSYTLIFGVLCGLSLGAAKLMVSHALLRGPSSLTFATVNSASVMPAFVIALTFGAFIDFKYTFWNLVGSLLVIAGLFWAVTDRLQAGFRKRWILFTAGAFLLQMFYLVLTQSHILIIKERLLPSFTDSKWFYPLVFVAAACLHIGLYFYQERRLPSRHELYWGFLGGVLNGACAYFFLEAAEIAEGNIRTVIFPLFSVTMIVACNIWGRYLYDERVNWPAHSLCMGGLIIGCL